MPVDHRASAIACGCSSARAEGSKRPLLTVGTLYYDCPSEHVAHTSHLKHSCLLVHSDCHLVVAVANDGSSLCRGLRPIYLLSGFDAEGFVSECAGNGTRGSPRYGGCWIIHQRPQSCCFVPLVVR